MRAQLKRLCQRCICMHEKIISFPVVLSFCVGEKVGWMYRLSGDRFKDMGYIFQGLKAFFGGHLTRLFGCRVPPFCMHIHAYGCMKKNCFSATGSAPADFPSSRPVWICQYFDLEEARFVCLRK